jgi:hypothetical protein
LIVQVVVVLMAVMRKLFKVTIACRLPIKTRAWFAIQWTVSIQAARLCQTMETFAGACPVDRKLSAASDIMKRFYFLSIFLFP